MQKEKDSNNNNSNNNNNNNNNNHNNNNDNNNNNACYLLVTCRRCQSTAEHSPPISVATPLCLSSFSSMSFLP